MNQLARREAAITSPVAGTTRDVIEVAIDLAGYPVVLADTAGLRESADLIEQEGLRRALARAESPICACSCSTPRARRTPRRRRRGRVRIRSRWRTRPICWGCSKAPSRIAGEGGRRNAAAG